MEGCGVWRKEQNFNLDLGLSLKKKQRSIKVLSYGALECDWALVSLGGGGANCIPRPWCPLGVSRSSEDFSAPVLCLLRTVRREVP